MSWEVWDIMSKTSLFNKGIYKSQLSRFKWGSLLYFILLFFTSSFLLLMKNSDNLIYALERYKEAGGMILHEDYLMISVLFATIVPTVVGFLTFDLFFSKRQSVFIHSLPCKRISIYISTILGAFTLMAVPVIANGIILMLLSVFKWSEFYTITACFKWIGINLILLFIMYSVAVLSASLTSNRVGFVVVNVLLHVFPLIIAFGMSEVATVYLYGFPESSNLFFDGTIRYLPAFYSWIQEDNITGLVDNILSTKTLIFALGALILYVIGFILYKKRNNEAAGNFVAFKVMNPIFKYAVTALGVILTFAVLHASNADRNFYMVLLLVVVSFVLYFSSEMVLKKNLKVFGAYKGYLVFVAVCILLNVFMEFTGFFGYETRIPKADNVESVAVYSYYNVEKPYTDDKNVIDDTIRFHVEATSDIPRVIENTEMFDYSTLHIEYKLKNGKSLMRTYHIPVDNYNNVMNSLYENEAYRYAADEIHKIDLNKVDYLRLTFQPSNNYSYGSSIEGKNNINAFIDAWERDIKELSYSQKTENNLIYLNIEYNDDNGDYVYFNAGFNHNFKNVMAYLEQNGNLDEMTTLEDANVYISKTAQKISFDENTEANEIAMQYSLERAHTALVEKADAALLAKDVLSGNVKESLDSGEKYLVYITFGSEDVLERFSLFLELEENQLPDYLRKYVQ